MSRSPFFRRLRRAVRRAVLEERGGPPARSLPWRAERSRRELLRDSGLLLAGWSLSCRSARPLRGTPEVVVVGAGLAGLTCATTLRAAGVPVRILEGQERVGGRVWSLADHFAEGQVCELGGELIDTGHRRMRALCEALELPLDDFTRVDPGLAETWYFGGRRRNEDEVVAAFRPLARRMDETLAIIDGDEVTARRPNGGEAIDRMSIAEWLDAAEVEPWMRNLLDAAYTTEFGLDIAEQSAWNLLMLISTTPDPFAVFGESDERFHVRGGNDRVAAGLAERVADAIELGTIVESISAAPDGRFRLGVARHGGNHEVVAERVVVTLPFNLLRRLRLDLPLPDEKRRAIEDLGYGSNSKLMIGFGERVWQAGGWDGSVLTDLPLQLVWETTRLQPGKGGILVAFSGGSRAIEAGDGSAEAQAARAAQQLETIFSGIAAARRDQVRFHWPSFPWARASYACYRTGQWTTIAGLEGERVGNLHFAGEHTSLEYQGYMEGACESGERVAGEILGDLGLA